MKKHLPLLLLLCFLSTSVFAKPYDYRYQKSLYAKMVHVNKEWLKRPHLLNAVWTPFEVLDEVHLVKTHLMNVEQELRLNPPKGLSPDQAERRNHHLDVLNAYWKAGEFPNNPDFAYRMPYFTGPNGNVCAVGHLMWEDGQQEVVNLITNTINNAFVEEIFYDELDEWAEFNGFTVDELAWIQPGYGTAPDGREASLWYEDLGSNIYRVYSSVGYNCGYGTAWGIADTNTVQLNPVGSPVGCGQPTPVSNWNRTTFRQLSSWCPGNDPGCSTSLQSPVKQAVFYRDYDFTGLSCQQWRISKNSLLRENFYHTSIIQGTYIDAPVIDLSIPGGNSSPAFSADPVFVVAGDNPQVLNIGAWDPDGDSLAFELAACQQSPGSLATYYPGTSLAYPLDSNWNVSIDPVTGDITCAQASGGIATNSIGMICVLVKEFRNGTQIGQVVRDMTMLSLSIPISNNNPEISAPMNISGGTWNSNHLIACQNASICFQLSVNDLDTLQMHTLMAERLPAGATMQDLNTQLVADSITGYEPTVEICWTPTQSGWHYIPLTVWDNSCPFRGNFSRSIAIYVKEGIDGMSANADTLGCSGAELSAISNESGVSWSWTGDYLTPSMGQTIQNQYPGPGTYNYTLTGTDANGCQEIQTGQVVIPNIGQPEFSVVTAQTGCKDVSLWVLPNGAANNWAYNWTGDAGIAANPAANDSLISHSFPGFGGFYWEVAVDDGNGCTVYYHDSIHIPDNRPNISPTSTLLDCRTVEFSAPVAGSAPANFSWSGQGGLDGNSDRFLQTLQHIYPGPGTYSWSVTVSSALGCDSTVSGTVVIPGIVPLITQANDSLFASNGVSFQWNLNGMPLPGATNPWFVPTISGNYSVTVTDSSGCSGTSSEVPFVVTSIISGLDWQVSVYPQPAENMLNVQLSGAVPNGLVISLRDLQGRLLKRQMLSGTGVHQMDISAYPAGVYLLVATTPDGQFVKKIIKQ